MLRINSPLYAFYTPAGGRGAAKYSVYAIDQLPSCDNLVWAPYTAEMLGINALKLNSLKSIFTEI